jgi:hypothetical protein
MKPRLKSNQEEQDLKSRPQDAAMDRVEEASEESFPASDAPSLTPENEEKGEETKNDPPAAEGCATSFLMQERGEIDKACGVPEPDPNEEYVQPEKEKEAGGEG